jgi:CRP-like cAMP-binding protein
LATTAMGSASGMKARPFAAFSEHVASAWAESFMGAFPEPVIEALLDGASESVVEAGDVFYRAAEHLEDAIVVLILDGLVRTYIRAPSGRQITIRYAWPGDVVGVPALVLAGVSGERGRELYGSHRLHAEALRETRLLSLRRDHFLQLAQTHAAVAYSVATSLAYLTVETEQMLEDGLFLSVRARVARHLLDLAVWRGGALVVAEGHREIADAIGSVREVVSRTLLRLRDEGLVERRESETVLLDPAGLHAVAAAG